MASLGIVTSASAATTLPGTCGQTISRPGTYVLGSDIGPCSSTAITISASKVTLNLEGHTVAGVPSSNDGPGIQIVGASNDVLTNGTVRDFNAGVLLTQSNASPPVPATFNTVSKLNVVNNAGVQPPADFSDGIALISANNNTITHNTLTGNGARAIGLIDSSNRNLISDNTITNNQSTGIRFSLFDTHNTISGNTITNNGGSGVSFMFNDTNNVVKNNAISSNASNGVGASFMSDSNLVKNNSITNNGLNGVSFGSGNDKVTGNTITGNGTAGALSSGNANGIFLTGGDTSTPSANDVVSNNVVLNNAGNGIMITCTRDASTGACVNYPQNNKIIKNNVHGNGGSAAGTQLFSSSGFLVGVYDLLDGNNPINNAATTPPGTSTPCDSNTWSGNANGTVTAYPSCTQG